MQVPTGVNTEIAAGVGMCVKRRRDISAEFHAGSVSAAISCVLTSRDELAALDSLVSPLIRKGQPLAHILAHHAEEIPCGERTLYKYISAGYLTARNLDMRRTVRYRKRVRSVPTPKISYRKKEGHHYSDYLDFIAKNEGIRVVQMDTVEGNKGGKLLHTL